MARRLFFILFLIGSPNVIGQAMHHLYNPVEVTVYGTPYLEREIGDYSTRYHDIKSGDVVEVKGVAIYRYNLYVVDFKDCQGCYLKDIYIDETPVLKTELEQMRTRIEQIKAQLAKKDSLKLLDSEKGKGEGE